jgi:hypothetical protein
MVMFKKKALAEADYLIGGLTLLATAYIYRLFQELGFTPRFEFEVYRVGSLFQRGVADLISEVDPQLIRPALY